ncbi:hypothetical protein, partial [Hydrogenovibrio marinus]
MDRFDYKVSKRPNFEIVQSGSWLASAAVLGVGSVALIHSSYFSLALPGVFAGIGIYRGYEAYRQYLRNKGFTAEQNIEFMSYEELKKKMRPDALWLGKGFAWTPLQTQRLYDEFLRNPEAMQNTNVDDPDAQTGGFWLHGLAEKELDIYKNIDNFDGHTLIKGVTGGGKTVNSSLISGQLLARKDEPL